jgi:hypothetical protein
MKMTRPRRAALMLLWIAVTVLGAVPHAKAAYADTTAVPTMSLTSINVAAPTGVTLAGTKCTTSYDWSTGTYTTTMHARLDWNPSTTPRGVSGYVVTVYFSDGTHYPYAQTDAATTALTGDYDASISTQNIRVTVTTLTSYGWTKESPVSGAVKC